MIVLPRFHNLVILPDCIEAQLESEVGLARTPSVAEMVPIKPTRIGKQALRLPMFRLKLLPGMKTAEAGSGNLSCGLHVHKNWRVN